MVSPSSIRTGIIIYYTSISKSVCQLFPDKKNKSGNNKTTQAVRTYQKSNVLRDGRTSSKSKSATGSALSQRQKSHR